MSWRERFDEIRERMLEYSVSVEHMDDDDEEEEEEEEDRPRRTEMSLEDLVTIMKDACVLLRQAKEERVEDFDIVLEQVDDLIRRAISRRLDMGSTGITSFAHTPDALVEDPWYDRMYLESKRDMYMSFIAHLGMDPRKVDEFIADSTSPLDPWRKEEQPHAQTTSLSRFRPGVEFPASSTHPHANFVFQARCEINNDAIREGGKLRISTDGSYMAMNTRGGYKSRDPVINYWNTGRDSEEFEHKSFVPPLAHLVVDHVIDDSRRLLFVADRERVKSYTYGSKRKAMHTLDSSAVYGTGPLALLSNGRVARSGKGSALIWNIDELETHYAPGSNDFHKIGDGTYKGFEDSWREEGCKQELSSGSMPHATVSYAVPDLLPRVWDYHAPSGLMLIGEDPRDSERCDCISMDLEHGGKVVTRFIGHGDRVEAFSLSDEDPNVFLTASADGYARLWDVRDNLPVLTFDVERGSASCNSALFIHLDSLPVVFTGGTESEGIRFWDVRAKKLVYELSTGNNTVCALAWDKQRTTLYAATEAEHRPGPRGRGVYRKARRVKRDHDAQPATEEDTEMDNEDIDENSMEFYDSLRWPHSAYHKEEYFGEVYDSGSKLMFRYAFKEDIDTDLIPPYGSGSFGGYLQ